MQQHSQIVELKDRLVQALDEQYNVKNLNEVKQIVATLEKANVTREDLERTRIGKFINELRRKTSDKELAKRSKKLIKSWREFSVGPVAGNVYSNSTTPNAALTSPFNPNSALSPPSLSNDSSAFSSSTYAPNSIITTNGHSRNSVLSPNGNSHPALLRIRNQHLTSPHEKSKPLSGQLVSPSQSSNLSPSGKSSFRPHSQTASPRESLSQLNGHLSKASSQQQQQRSHSNLTSPANASSLLSASSLSGKNGLSPGLRNSFKNILGKEGTSPNANSIRRRTTPPMASSQGKPDKASLSKHSSPLAFSFSSDSRDSTSLHSHKSSSYSNQGEYSPPDTNDEDSNSSVFSNLSNDGGGHAAYTSRSLLDAPNANKSRNVSQRKRKLDSETDSLRDNLNSILNAGTRRLQSTQELAQKFKVNLPTNKGPHSLSASSSPMMHIGRDGAVDAKRAKLSRNGAYKNGFHHLEENSLDEYESALLRKNHLNNKSLPSSPALLLRNAHGAHSATTSPALLSRLSYEYDDDDDELYSKASSISKPDKSSALPSPDNSASFDFARRKRGSAGPPTGNDVDRVIMQIYQQLPPVNPIDAALMEDFKFDTGEYEDEVDAELKSEEQVTIKQEVFEFDGDEDEYELCQYYEEYEVEEEEEIEVTDDEYHESDEEEEEEDDVEMKSESSDVDSCVHTNKPEALDSDADLHHREHTTGDIFNCDKPTAVDTGSEPPQDAELKSQSTAVDTTTSCDSVHHDEEDFQPDSTFCDDDSNDAIPTSTTNGVMMQPEEEADSTTNLNEEREEEEEAAECNDNGNQPESSADELVAAESPCENLSSIYTDYDFFADIELLDCHLSESCLLEEFPLLAKYPGPLLSEQPKEETPAQAEETSIIKVESQPTTSSSNTKDPPPSTSSSSQVPPPKAESSPPPSPMQTSDVEDDQSDDGPSSPPQVDDDDDEQSSGPKAEPSVETIAKVKRKRTKLVLMPVKKKKLRKCVARLHVKRALVDQLAEEHWEFVNGTYDKDGDWRDFGEMTSAYVLRGGTNAPSKTDENILHILPYASFSW